MANTTNTLPTFTCVVALGRDEDRKVVRCGAPAVGAYMADGHASHRCAEHRQRDLDEDALIVSHLWFKEV